MYFPYLRGRQYELIALRELAEKDILSQKIIPIIEPVKLSITFVRTLQAYRKSNRKLALITNPLVGSFDTDLTEQKNLKLREEYEKTLEGADNILYLNILEKDSEIQEFISKYAPNIGTVCQNKDSIAIYEKYFANSESRYNLVPDESIFRRKIRENRVLFSDRFNKKDRNSDYINPDDEPFSEDHLYYCMDEYTGFSDYSIIGKEYVETGFAPVAVAIHIVYPDMDGGLRVRHFVSDSNDDIRNLPGKFQEAVSKLVLWNKEMGLNTEAIKRFEDLNARESYPGLGTVKKLTIMHHLELIGRYLDRE